MTLLAIRAACLAAAALTSAASAQTPAPAQAGGQVLHAIAMHGGPALPADFAHLPYADPSARKGGRFVWCLPGAFDSLNPFNVKAGSTAQGLNVNVFQTLMARSFDEPFTLYGLIAQTIETDEARSYVTFRLDPRAKFSDGAPITADDVLFTFDLLKNQGRPPVRFAFGQVKKAEKLDDRTLRYDLTGLNDRELPLTLAMMPVLPKHKVDPRVFSETTLTPPTGSGPYKITEVRPGERLTLTRDPNYWGNDIRLHKGLFNFDEIRVDYYRDGNAMFEAFKAGACDYRMETDPTRWLRGYDFAAARDGRVTRESSPFGLPKGMEGFAFNTRRALFADPRVREALALMFDFEWINANLYGGLYTRTKSFFDDSELSSNGRPASPRERVLLAPFAGAVREDVMEGRWAPPMSDGSGQNREAAKRALALLADAGWNPGPDGALVKAGVPLAFEIMVQQREQERLAVVYAQSLRKIGVTARVRQVDEVQYQRRRQKFDFDMMPGSWIASPSPGYEQRGRWGSAAAAQEGSFNLVGLRSPAVDSMIEAMVAAKGHDDFVSAVRALDRLLLSGFYIVPFYHTSDQWIAYSSALAKPSRTPMFGVTLDTWWRKAP
jgi:peptide/nickel transport system substrate-binding protein